MQLAIVLNRRARWGHACFTVGVPMVVAAKSAELLIKICYICGPLQQHGGILAVAFNPPSSPM